MHVDVVFLQYYSGILLSCAGKVARNAKNFHGEISSFFFLHFLRFHFTFLLLLHTYVNNKENTRKCNKFLVDYKNSCIWLCVCVSQSNRQRALLYRTHTHDEAQLKTQATCGLCVCVCAQQRLTNFL